MKTNAEQIRDINFVKRIVKSAERNRPQLLVTSVKPKAKGPKPKAVRTETPELLLQKQVNSLFRSIEHTLTEDFRLVHDRLPFNSVAIDIFKVVRKLTVAERKTLIERIENKYSSNPEMIKSKIANIPTEVKCMAINIYRNVYDKNKIGSVTVYGESILDIYYKVKRTGSFYGLSVSHAEINQGCAPYIDIKVRG